MVCFRKGRLVDGNSSGIEMGRRMVDNRDVALPERHEWNDYSP